MITESKARALPWTHQGPEALGTRHSRGQGQSPRLASATDNVERRQRRYGPTEERLRAAAALLPALPLRDIVRHVNRLDGVAVPPCRDLSAGAVAPVLAALREVADRVLGLRPYDVQLTAAWAMLQGRVAELATGEGKTLAAALTAATAALAGRTVHVVTVNDYLAARDHAALSPFHAALGLSAGLVVHGQSPAERRAAYACDVVYASNKELAFDYLRDQIARRGAASPLHARLGRLTQPVAPESTVMRGLVFAIVDEADSVLIDEARTPLIISETTDATADHGDATAALGLVGGLCEGEDYRVDRSRRHIDLTPVGQRRVEALSRSMPSHRRGAGLSAGWGDAVSRSELVRRALTARLLFERDVHYLVRDGSVRIIDEYTGRVMADRFWNDGLQQMVEAKEGCAPSRGRAAIARITYQRFFTRYVHLCGMSGTLAEVAGELAVVYGLRVARVPTHRPCRRVHAPTLIVPDEATKWRLIAGRARGEAASGRPVLIGTRSVAASERASRLLREAGAAHALLNAAQDAGEAAVVAQAGAPGRITIATNMAGRGTDIRLGAGVAAAGGLAVILSERHDSSRIDRQLAGRGARQGEPGSFAAILSLEDALLDPLRLTRTGRAMLQAAGRWPRLGGWLFAVAQGRAQRRHRLVRREMMRFETRLSDSLCFAGRPD